MGYENDFMRLLKACDIDIDTYCKDLFRGLMVLRDIQYFELYAEIGGRASAISERTLEGYGGSASIRRARAYILCRIAKVLDVDPFCLVGEKSIHHIWNNEKDRNVCLMMTGDEELENPYLEKLRRYTRTLTEAERQRTHNQKKYSQQEVDEMMAEFFKEYVKKQSDK